MVEKVFQIYYMKNIKINKIKSENFNRLHFNSSSDIKHNQFRQSVQSKKKNLSRFIKWPKYIRIQRQRRILSKRLKIPTLINQFTKILNLNLTRKVFKILSKYELKNKNYNKTDSNIEQIEKEGKDLKQKKIFFLKHGINTVANLIRKKKALFVLIANDVNPIEMVMWLPSLCKKLGVPFCIIKNKARLGNLVNRKKTSCLALQSFLNEDKGDLSKIISCFKFTFDQKLENIKK
ncbi:60S ribosomal protein L7A (nucleomorph) [Chroomonas mesostigmatica CCMP1168]|uniref:60S ribosomal protein L7a n=1 Tax=Chroomonas mesostigmatica CCMP1168 TaxID=1195612 RepID=J7G2S4_9CRYP|nr:60S ribosomal protein L7A [Chroomonas mesostigmatica CCMP1168]|mmetsp:Transcript_60046/g.147648  ORF Transcript_60046/g.147648 Transcript_60046/m.147648 type:complete len:234 (-) Transcript_60046:757-1458(-)